MSRWQCQTVSPRKDAFLKSYFGFVVDCSRLMREPVMTISDFRIFQAAVESRYDDAYLLFDRTGAICRELRIKWPDSKLQEASPAKTICRNGPEAFSLDLRQAAHVL